MTPSDPAWSPRLQAFVDEAPVARAPHVAFLRSALEGLAPGARILDVGAGDAPYRELFSDFDYVTNDWAGTEHEPDLPYDLIAPAHDLPAPDASFDAIVCTQVLEHLPEPWVAVEEFRRLLVPGGRVIITAPLTWYLHELPHDYYRFTAYGLAHLLQRAGFHEVDVQPMNDSPATIAELLRHLRWTLGEVGDGRDEARAIAGEVVAGLAAAVERLSWLDTQRLMPISFSAIAFVPSSGGDERSGDESPGDWSAGDESAGTEQSGSA